MDFYVKSEIFEVETSLGKAVIAFQASDYPDAYRKFADMVEKGEFQIEPPPNCEHRIKIELAVPVCTRCEGKKFIPCQNCQGSDNAPLVPQRNARSAKAQHGLLVRSATPSAEP